MLKETILHTKYKDGKYTDEPSHIFIYKDYKKKYVGFHCYFLDTSSEFNYKFSTEVVFLDEINYSSKFFAKKNIDEEFVNEIKQHIKEYNYIWKTNYNKIAIINVWNKFKGNKIFRNNLEFVIYEI